MSKENKKLKAEIDAVKDEISQKQAVGSSQAVLVFKRIHFDNEQTLM